MTQVLKSEWTKIRSVSSTMWTLGLAALVTIGIGTTISVFAARSHDGMSAGRKAGFQPTETVLAGTSLGQLALIVFGVLVVTNEYSTGMIRTSLAAVPGRRTFLTGKVVVATAVAFAVALVTSFLTFFIGSAVLGDHADSLGDHGVLRAVIGSALYMTLIAVISMGVATVLRSPTLSMSVLMPFFFLVSTVLASIPATEKFARWLPDQAGGQIMHVVPDSGAPYGPWGGLIVMCLWAGATVLGGYAVLRRRDA